MAGAEVLWESGKRSTVGAFSEREELSLVDELGVWLTWTLSPVTENRVAVSLSWDRPSPLSMEAAFAWHGKLVEMLRSLQNAVEPKIPLCWERHLSDGGDTGSPVGPVLGQNTILVGVGNQLHALNVDGSVEWKLAPGWGNNPCQIVFASDLVVVTTLSDCLLGLELKSGKKRWKSASCGKLWNSVTPVSDGERVSLVNTSNRLYTLDARSGEVLRLSSLRKRSSRPAIKGGLLFAVDTPCAFALDICDGAVRWTVDATAMGIHLSSCRPAVHAGIVYLGTDRGLVALSAETGSMQWVADTYTGPKSDPVLVDGRFYIRTADHSVRCFNLVSRQQEWRYAVTARQEESSHSGPREPIVLDGVVYCELGDEAIHAICAATGQHLWSVPAGGYPRFAVDHARIYYIVGRRLCALDIGRRPTQDPSSLDGSRG